MSGSVPRISNSRQKEETIGDKDVPEDPEAKPRVASWSMSLSCLSFVFINLLGVQVEMLSILHSMYRLRRSRLLLHPESSNKGSIDQNSGQPLAYLIITPNSPARCCQLAD